MRDLMFKAPVSRYLHQFTMMLEVIRIACFVLAFSIGIGSNALDDIQFARRELVVSVCQSNLKPEEREDSTKIKLNTSEFGCEADHEIILIASRPPLISDTSDENSKQQVSFVGTNTCAETIQLFNPSKVVDSKSICRSLKEFWTISSIDLLRRCSETRSCKMFQDSPRLKLGLVDFCANLSLSGLELSFHIAYLCSSNAKRFKVRHIKARHMINKVSCAEKRLLYIRKVLLELTKIQDSPISTINLNMPDIYSSESDSVDDEFGHFGGLKDIPFNTIRMCFGQTSCAVNLTAMLGCQKTGGSDIFKHYHAEIRMVYSCFERDNIEFASVSEHDILSTVFRHSDERGKTYVEAFSNPNVSRSFLTLGGSKVIESKSGNQPLIGFEANPIVAGLLVSAFIIGMISMAFVLLARDAPLFYHNTSESSSLS